MSVRALRELRFKTSRGEIVVKAGQLFKPADPQKLLDAGLVSVLPPDQTGEPVETKIYSKTEVIKALRKTAKEIRRPCWQREDSSCYACNRREVWTSIYGVMVCGVCHPPASAELVSRWIGRA